MEKRRRFIGREIRSLDNKIKRSIENRMKNHGMEPLSGANCWIIGYIAEHPDEDVYQKDLEQKLGITRSTASKVVNLMVEKGFILRKSVKEDARLKKLVLTEDAKRCSQWIDQDRRFMDEKLETGFSDEELMQFYSYLDRLQENVEKYL